MASEAVRSFVEQGFVVLPGVIDQALVANARRVVNSCFGQGVSAEGAAKAKKGSWFPEITSDGNLLSCFNLSAPLHSFLREILGENAPLSQYNCQIALRFPGDLCNENGDGSYSPNPSWDTWFHIDGLPDKHNGIAPGTIKNFTLLVGIPLSDAEMDFAGNLVVYPTSHFDTQRYFLQKGFQQAQNTGLDSLSVALSCEAKMVHAKRGDVIVAHYSLAHSIAPNISPDIRYMLYFRLNMRGPAFHPEPMLSIFIDFSASVQTLAKQVETKRQEEEKKEQERRGGGEGGGGGRGGGGRVRAAGYVDAVVNQGPGHHHNQNQSNQYQHLSGDEITSLMTETKLLMNRKDFRSAAPLYEKLLSSRGKGQFDTRLQAAICFTVHPDVAMLAKGENLLRNLMVQFPKYPLVRSLLAANLVRSCQDDPAVKKNTVEAERRKQEALDLSECAIVRCSLATENDGKPDFVVECLQRMLGLGCDGERMGAVKNCAMGRYPCLKQRIEEECSQDQVRVAQLWGQGKAWMAGPDPKDLHQGLRIFSAIAAASPLDYWATFIMGACLLHTNRLGEAESALQRALDINDALPHAYAALAACLRAQKRDPLPMIERMLLVKEGLEVKDKDAQDKIVDALQIALDVLSVNNQGVTTGATGKNHPRYQNLISTTAILHPDPVLQARIQALQCGSNKGCVVC